MQNIVKLIAPQGKVFARKEDGEVLGGVLWLGNGDSADNYVEVDKPESAQADEE